MTDDEINPLGPLRDLDIGPPAPVDAVAARLRSRTRRRQLGAACAVVLGLAGLAVVIAPDGDESVTPDVATNPPAPDTPVDTTTSVPACADLPYFATVDPTGRALEPDQFLGSAGVAPGSDPVESGEFAWHWIGEFGVVAELRGPDPRVQEGAPRSFVPNDLGLVIVAAKEPIDGRLVADIVDPDAPDACGVVSIEMFGPQLDPVVDAGWTFASGLRPVADLPQVLTALDLETTQATPTEDRPIGACGRPINVAGDEPTERQLLDLAENFATDRLRGAAAELCLTVPGLSSFQTSQPTEEQGLPALCLFTCPEATMTAGVAQLDRGGQRPELLVDYVFNDGSSQKFREVFQVEVTNEGLLLLSSAALDVDSWITESQGRAVIGELLDALAAEEWDSAAATLINEGALIDPRLGGEDWYSQPYDEVFPNLCATALCGAAYVIGDTVSANESSRTMEVTFETAAGAVTLPMEAWQFEGAVTAGTLPPDGDIGTPLERLDIRVFGEEYDGDMVALRDRSIERFRNGESAWTTSWQYRRVPREFAVVDGKVVFDGFAESTSVQRAVTVDEDAGSLVSIGDPAGGFLGASIAGGQPLVFLASTDGDVSVADLETGDHVVLPCANCVAPSDNRRISWVDAGEDRIAVGELGSGGLVITVYEFDPARLELGPEVGRIVSEEHIGEPHLSPDGQSAAVVLRGRLEPPKTVTVFDVASGTPAAEWTLDGEATVQFIDYDGRFLVAELSDATTWVIDTELSGTDAARIVDTAARIRFG